MNQHQPCETNEIIPAFMSATPVNIAGTAGRRLMVVYRALGCERARLGQACAMCNFQLHNTISNAVETIPEQHKHVLGAVQQFQCEQVDLMVSGNFFNPNELPENLAHEILLSLSKIPYIKRIGVESRREYVSMERLKKARACLRPDQRLSLLFGYESSREDVRNTCLRKDVPEKYLDDVLGLCRETHVDLGAYILVKPPGLTEAEAIDDAVNSAVHVMQKAQRQNVEATIHFNPMFVAQGTLLEKYYLAGQYKPPQLWSVIEVIKRTAQAWGLSNTQGKIFVGLSDENISGGRMFRNCGACDSQIIREIQEFNGHQDVTRLGKIDCACRGRWEKAVNSIQIEIEPEPKYGFCILPNSLLF